MASKVRVLNERPKKVAIADLRLHPENPNQGDVGAIHEMISETGFYGFIVVQKSTNYVLAGNHRMQAMEAAGETEIPVVYIDVDDETAKRILTGDNRSSELSTRDKEILSRLLQELYQTAKGLAGTGYDGDDLDAMLYDLKETNADDLLTGGGGSSVTEHCCPNCGHTWTDEDE